MTIMSVQINEAIGNQVSKLYIETLFRSAGINSFGVYTLADVERFLSSYTPRSYKTQLLVNYLSGLLTKPRCESPNEVRNVTGNKAEAVTDV